MAREPITQARIEQFLRQLGQRYHGGGRLYLVGDTQMVYAGFRRQTEDIDYVVRLEGNHGDFTMVVRSLIRELDISVEPANPGDLIPLPAGWEDRSHFIGRYGSMDVFTFDSISTALSKIERGSNQDIDDVLSLLQSGNVLLPELSVAFEEILPRLERESLRVEEEDFRRKFEAVIALAAVRGIGGNPCGTG